MNKRYADLTEEQKRKACARSKKWRQAHLEEERAKDRDRGRLNPEKEYIRNRKWRKANPEKVLAKVKRWQKANPEKVRSIHQKWQEANPEKVSASNKKWRKNNPESGIAHSRKRRALKRGQAEHFTEYEWKLLCDQYDHRCLKCGKQKPLTADHVIPLVLGGKDTIDNIQPLCASCNSRKGATYADYRNREPIRVEQLSIGLIA